MDAPDERKEGFDLFISYARVDDESKVAGRVLPVVRELKKLLESHVRPGSAQERSVRFRACTDREDFEVKGTVEEAIEARIAVSRALLVVCSEAAKGSPYVRDEIGAFRTAHPGSVPIGARWDLSPDEAFPDHFPPGSLGADLAYRREMTLRDWRRKLQDESHKIVARAWGVPIEAVHDRWVADRRAERRRAIVALASVLVALLAVLGPAFWLYRREQIERATAAKLVSGVGSAGEPSALWEIAEVAEDVRLAFFRAAFSAPDPAARLGERAELWSHAAVGVDPARARRLRTQILLPVLDDPRADPRSRLGAVKVGLASGFADPGFSRAASRAILDGLRAATREPQRVVELCGLLRALDPGAPATDAQEAVTLTLGAMEAVTVGTSYADQSDTRSLGELSAALAGLPGALSDAEADQLLAILRRSWSKYPYDPQQVVFPAEEANAALRVVIPKLSPAKAEVFARQIIGTLSLFHEDENRLESLGRTEAAASAALPAAARGVMIGELLAPDDTTDHSLPLALCHATILAELAPEVPSERASEAEAALVRAIQLAGAERVPALARGFARLPGTRAEGSLRTVTSKILECLREVPAPFLWVEAPKSTALEEALALLAPRLPKDALLSMVEPATKALVGLDGKKSDPRALSRGLAVLVKLLTSAEAQRVDDDLRGLVGGAVPLERVIDPLAAVEAHLATSTHPNAVELVLHAILATAAPPLAEPWVLRGRRSVLAAALDRAALQFPDAMRETPPATVREAAEILSSLDAQDAARDRSLAALAIRLPPDHARKFFARALADIAEPHRPSIFPSPGGTLWQGPKVQAAAALASTLSSDDALGAVHAVAELIARNGKDIDPMLEIGFPSLLSAAVDRAPASGAAQAVEELLRLSPRHELARGVFEALRIAASRVPEADTTAAVGALMRAMRRDTTPEHMNPLARTLAAVPGLSVRDAIDALKYPGCVGPAREALLSAVEARTALKLGTLVEKVSAGEAAAGLRRSDVTDGPRDRPEAR